MIASIIDMLGQAMTLGEKNGVNREKFYEVMQVSIDVGFITYKITYNFVVQLLFPAPPLLGYAKRLATDDLECPEGGGFTSTLGLKDVSHIRSLGQQ